jgi:hypothetical protein
MPIRQTRLVYNAALPHCRYMERVTIDEILATARKTWGDKHMTLQHIALAQTAQQRYVTKQR